MIKQSNPHQPDYKSEELNVRAASEESRKERITQQSAALVEAVLQKREKASKRKEEIDPKSD